MMGVQEGITMYRGVNFLGCTERGEGDIVHWRDYTSTSTDRDATEMFSRAEGALFDSDHPERQT